MNDVLFAFLLTLFAGLFTGAGGIVALFSKRRNTGFLAVCLSFSAGVMIYISFVEIFQKALEGLRGVHGEDLGTLFAVIAFFGGILLITAINRLIPHKDETEASLDTVESLSQEDTGTLHRTGLMSALAISIHNFPEGMITFMAALYDPTLGVAIAAAIAMHNIPEGIATAAPIYYATGSKKKAILIASASGITEPLGALFAYFLLSNLFGHALNGYLFGLTFAAVGGMMVYISISQLLPIAGKFGRHSQVMKGLFAGMAVMALSLIVL